MPIAHIASVIHLREDTAKTFDLVPLLKSLGYSPLAVLTITQMSALDANGAPGAAVPAGLLTQVDHDTVRIDPSVFADRNGDFGTLRLTIADGKTGYNVVLDLQVIVDPVNDAPTAEDHTITLGAATSYAVKASDFGFADQRDQDATHPAGNNFKSVIVTALPSGGSLFLNGVAVTAFQEIKVSQIDAGRLVYKAVPGVAQDASIGFEVRDDGGRTAGGNDTVPCTT